MHQHTFYDIFESPKIVSNAAPNLGPLSLAEKRSEKVKADSRPSLFPDWFRDAKAAPKTMPLLDA